MLLQIFEPRYMEMVKKCMQEDSGFGICLIDEPDAETSEPSIFNIGTYAKIYDFEKLANGMLGLHCRGEKRFSVKYDGADQDNLHYGIIKWWQESACQEQPSVMQSCVEYLLQIINKNKMKVEMDEQNLHNPNWVSYRLAEILPLTSRSKQTILEMNDAALRMKTLYAVVQTLEQGTRLS